MGKALCSHSKSCKHNLNLVSNNAAVYCLRFPVSNNIYIQHLPTFVPDQHALQRSTSCDLTQPQFPVHLLLWLGWQKDSVSTKTPFPFVHCDSKLFLKKNKKNPTVSQTMETEELKAALQVIAFTVEYVDCTHSNRRVRERHKGISSQIIY